MRNKKKAVISALAFLLCCVAPARAFAAYVTFENVWGNQITFVNMGFWDVAHTVEIGELWSSDYGLRPPDAFPLDITNANPLQPGQTYMTPLIPWMPDTGFTFTGLGVAGAFGFTSLNDADPGHTVIIPGSDPSVI